MDNEEATRLLRLGIMKEQLGLNDNKKPLALPKLAETHFLSTEEYAKALQTPVEYLQQIREDEKQTPNGAYSKWLKERMEMIGQSAEREIKDLESMQFQDDKTKEPITKEVFAVVQEARSFLDYPDLPPQLRRLILASEKISQIHDRLNRETDVCVAVADLILRDAQGVTALEEIKKLESGKAELEAHVKELEAVKERGAITREDVENYIGAGDVSITDIIVLNKLLEIRGKKLNPVKVVEEE